LTKTVKDNYRAQNQHALHEESFA